MLRTIARLWHEYPVAAPIVVGGASLLIASKVAPDGAMHTALVLGGVGGIALGGARVVGVLPGGAASVLRGNPPRLVGGKSTNVNTWTARISRELRWRGRSDLADDAPRVRGFVEGVVKELRAAGTNTQLDPAEWAEEYAFSEDENAGRI